MTKRADVYNYMTPILSKYNSLNKSPYDVPRCKLEMFSRSFVPDAD